uniref:Putative homing endonuclease n=1 Tax=viral metagenome TaxID=1070528 RepID=A0A6M3K4U7_9ZZZZ
MYRANRSHEYDHLYGNKWRVNRALWLAKYPLCVICDAAGVVKAAEIVDHIIPHKGDTVLFWYRPNWQSLCKECHDKKTQKEGAWGK